jgi:GntR family transcriptional regulator
VIDFRLVKSSGVPTYQQLVNQVKQALRLGTLRPGDQLPTARDVVARLAINPNTVLKAYRELEREGLVTARPGQGTFVTRALGNTAGEQTELLARRAAELVLAAVRAGLDRDDVEALLAAVVTDVFGKVPGKEAQ